VVGGGGLTHALYRLRKSDTCAWPGDNPFGSLLHIMGPRRDLLTSPEKEHFRAQDRKHKASQRQREREGTQTTTEALTTAGSARAAVFNFNAPVTGVAFGNDIKENEMYGPAPKAEEKAKVAALQAEVQAEAHKAEKLKRENVKLKKQVEQLLTSSRLPARGKVLPSSPPHLLHRGGEDLSACCACLSSPA